MLLIDDVLISDDVLEEHFFCKLDACKGACCYEGDYGAPLENEEIGQIESVLDKIWKYLPDRSKDAIEEKGVFEIFSKEKFKGTPLHEDGSCVFLSACQYGEKKQVPLFRFLKEALIRKYGAAFYEELDAAYLKHYQKNKND